MSHLCPRCAHKYRDCRCGSPDNRDMPCGACGKTHEPRPCPLPARDTGTAGLPIGSMGFRYEGIIKTAAEVAAAPSSTTSTGHTDAERAAVRAYMEGLNKPAPVVPAHPYGCARCYGFGHAWDGTVQVPCLACRDAKPAPVVAVSAVSAEDAAEARRHERERVASLAYAWLLGKLDVDTRLQLHTVLRSASPEAPKGYAIEPAPVVAAEGLPTRFALPSDFVPKMRARIRDHDGACGCVECVAYCLGFADCEDEVESKSKTRRRKSTVEAIEAARREERERIVRGVIAAFAKYDRECWARIDGSAYSTGAITGCRNRFMAVVTGDEEAAKGQAK